MKYFLDTEFVETVGHIELISIGLYCEDGREYYAVNSEADLSNADEWVKKNVLAKMPEYDAAQNDLYASVKTMRDIKNDILEFCGQEKATPEECEFYGYYSDYDWVVFCWIFGRMIHLPKGFPMYCIDLKQMLDDKVKGMLFSKRIHFDILGTTEKQLTLKEKVEKVKAHPDYPKQEDEHNALADAKWNYELYKFLVA